MTQIIHASKLTREAFIPFGDVIETNEQPDFIINQGQCGRYHDLAKIQIDGDGGKPAISLFSSETRSLPYSLDMMERHPLGSQAFLPMSMDPFLVIVARDKKGVPDTPVAFITEPGQGVNYHANTWHGVLTPLNPPGLFAVVDRVGDGDNLEEYWFDEMYEIRA